MKIHPISTRKITAHNNRGLIEILDRSLKRLPERSILVITSKIISLCEGRILPFSQADKAALIRQEADYYLPPRYSRYHASLSIKHSAFIAAGGIDESNGNGHFILHPHNPQKTANIVRKYLKQRFGHSSLGVIITDSRSVPLRRGAIGVALAWSGFRPVKDYRQSKDLFGRIIRYEISNLADALAVAAVAVMGEGKEQTPLCLITDIPQIEFVNRNPTSKERGFFFIDPKDDLFAPLFNYRHWRKGQSSLLA